LKRILSSALWFPLVCALLWLATRWIYGSELADSDILKGRTFGVFLNLFFILLLVGLGMFSFRWKKLEGGGLARFKHLVRYPLVYSFFVTIAIFSFYSYMSDEVEMKRSKDMAEMESILTNPEKLASLKAENESLAEMNADQIREMGKSRIYSMTSPKVITSIGFLMLCVSSVGYTFLALLLSSLFLKK